MQGSETIFSMSVLFIFLYNVITMWTDILAGAYLEFECNFRFLKMSYFGRPMTYGPEVSSQLL